MSSRVQYVILLCCGNKYFIIILFLLLCSDCIACGAVNDLGIRGKGFGPCADSLSDKKAMEIPAKDPLHDKIIQVNNYVQKCIHIHIYEFKRQCSNVFDLCLFNIKQSIFVNIIPGIPKLKLGDVPYTQRWASYLIKEMAVKSIASRS